MNDSPNDARSRPPASPADARTHRPWSLRKKIVLYALMLALAILSIWFVDRRVNTLAEPHRSAQP